MPEGPHSSVPITVAEEMTGRSQRARTRASTYPRQARGSGGKSLPEQETDHAGVVGEPVRLRLHRAGSDVKVVVVPGRAARIGMRFPLVATLPARQHEDARLVGHLVELRVLSLALQPDRVEPDIERVAELVRDALGVVPKEQVRRPATAADRDRLSIQHEPPSAAGGDLTRQRSDAEGRRHTVAEGAVHAGLHLEVVKSLIAEPGRPPEGRVPELCLDSELSCRGCGAVAKTNLSLQLDLASRARDRHAHVGHEWLAAKVGDLTGDDEMCGVEPGRELGGDPWITEANRACRSDEDIAPDAHVVVGRPLAPVHPADRQVGHRAARVNEIRNGVGAPADQMGDVERVRRVGTGDDVVTGDAGPVHPEVGLGDDPVRTDSRTGPWSPRRTESGAEPPGDLEHRPVDLVA